MKTKTKNGRRENPQRANASDESYFRVRGSLMRSLGRALRGPVDKLDPAVRNVTIKFSRLPFATMQGACEGYFYKKGRKEMERIPLGKMNPKDRVKSHSAYFCIIFRDTPGAMEFRQDLEALKKKMPSVEIQGSMKESDVVNIFAHSQSNWGIPVTKEEAYKIREANLLFIKEFERIVDKYLKRYSLRRKH